MPAWNSPSDSRPRLHHPDPPLPTSVQARSRTSRSLYPASSWPAIPADHLALTRNPHHRRQTMTKTILITGTSSGFGRETAERLGRAGYRVFAARRPPPPHHPPPPAGKKKKKRGVNTGVFPGAAPFAPIFPSPPAGRKKPG